MTRRISILVALILWVGVCFSQTIESLQEEIRRAEEQITKTNNLLDKTREDQRTNQRQLKLVRNRIGNRKRIVANLNTQISMIDRDIKKKNNSINTLNGQLAQLKKEYASMICSAYKSYRLNNYLLFLFSAADFNDISRRIFYIKRYNQMRESQAAKIASTSNRLSTEISSLEQKSQTLDKTKKARNKELQSLSKDEKQYNNTLSTLKTQEKNLSRTIRSSQKQIQKLQGQIERIIAEEARKNKKADHSVEYKKQFEALSSLFNNNAGRLPMPVEDGVIIDHYGRHKHPTQKGLIIDNKGINIAAGRKAKVRCVSDGEVTRIFFFQGLNNSVMVRHGSYLTVYSNLHNVSVKNNQKVSAGQVLGTLSDSKNSEEHVLHFEIWRETQNLNPEYWLKR